MHLSSFSYKCFHVKHIKRYRTLHYIAVLIFFWLCNNQDLPESQRADAVSSMVYEANARLRDPVYGCAGAICQLQKQVGDLQAELAKAKAEIVNMQCQQANLLALICMEMKTQSQDDGVVMPMSSPQDPYETSPNNNFLNFYDDNNTLSSVWEPLWT